MDADGEKAARGSLNSVFIREQNPGKGRPPRLMVELSNLVQVGYSDEEIIKMLKIRGRAKEKRHKLRIYKKRLSAFLLTAKEPVGQRLEAAGRHCDKPPVIVEGEIVCSKCGVVLGYMPKKYDGLELPGRAPVNSLLWNNNLGGDEKQLVVALRKAGFLKKLNSSDLKVDDELTKRVKLVLAQKARAQGLDYAETDRLARMAMKRVRVHLSTDQAEMIAEATWSEFTELRARR